MPTTDPTTLHKITVTAKIVSPLGETVFCSSAENFAPGDANASALFSSIIPPMEKILSDAHKQYALPPEAFDDETAAEPQPSDLRDIDP